MGGKGIVQFTDKARVDLVEGECCASDMRVRAGLMSRVQVFR